jgi:hypothetical protein
MKTTQQLEQEIREADALAAQLDQDAIAAIALPFYGSGKAARIANLGRQATDARMKSYRLRKQLPFGHPMKDPFVLAA